MCIMLYDRSSTVYHGSNNSKGLILFSFVKTNCSYTLTLFECDIKLQLCPFCLAVLADRDLGLCLQLWKEEETWFFRCFLNFSGPLPVSMT